jgi:hypothetical protein
VQVLLQLMMAGVHISRSFKVGGMQMSLWVVALLTCIQIVGAWRMHA